MDATKIRLSAEEVALLQNADFILTKNNIIQKVQLLFAELLAKEQAWIHTSLQEHLPELTRSTPKISRGENYKGLPWLVADYPRVFEKEKLPDPVTNTSLVQAGTLAIRQLCWWGNYFSTTLHLSGKYIDHYREQIISSIPLLKENDYWLCDQEDEWQHHFENGYYRHMKGYPDQELEKQIGQRRFIKIAKKLPLALWETAVDELEKNFKLLTGILKVQSER